MKRRTLALLSAAALATAAAAGCSSSSSSPAASASASPGSANFGVNATGTVQFWARTVSKTLAQKLVNEFNASHSNLKVKLTLTSINDDTTSLATSIRAGDPPDVVGLNDIDAFLFSWTEFVGALTFLTSNDLYTLPLALLNMESGSVGQVNFGFLEAGAVIAMIPCLVLYVALQRYYVRGLTSGVVKG